VDDVALAQNLLRRAIEDAYPLFVAGATARGHVELEGTAQSLRLLSPAPRALGKGGRARWSLAVSRDAGKADLLVTAAPELAGDSSHTARKVLLPTSSAWSLRTTASRARSVRPAGTGNGRARRSCRSWCASGCGFRRAMRASGPSSSSPRASEPMWAASTIRSRGSAGDGSGGDMEP
jgi:hypothetical protein